jgi:hypothetical protein
MKRFSILPGILLFAFPFSGWAQTRPAPNEFQITRITRNLITSPIYSYDGAENYPIENRDSRWIEVEVEFASLPELTDELTFRYFVFFGGKLFTGEVTHINIPAGKENRSVIYMSPQTVARFAPRGILTPNSVQNVAVQLLQHGAVKSELSLNRAPPRWYATLPAMSGLLLNKNDTPFAPLYWERYPQIKVR